MRRMSPSFLAFDGRDGSTARTAVMRRSFGDPLLTRDRRRARATPRSMSPSFVQSLADTMMLGTLLELLRRRCGAYELVDHWRQGEFHHDIIVQVQHAKALPGKIVAIATNCNGGVKEVLCFDEIPERSALWHWRCPRMSEFSGALPPILARATTHHWFDPAELLGTDARSELKAEYRRRQPGGGWEMAPGALRALLNR